MSNPMGDRIVSIVRAALADGPMGKTLRTEAYRAFIACGLPPWAAMKGPDGRVGGDITGIKTSCALFAGAVLWHAGVAFAWLRMWSGAMLANWFQLDTRHPSWVSFADIETIEPGDFFFLGSLSGTNGHMGIFLEETSPGFWITAEGGGGDGTKCQITKGRRYDPRNAAAFDPSMGRKLAGIFRSRLIEAGEQPAPPPVPAPAPRTLRLVTPHLTGEDVREWQAVLDMHVTGIYDETTQALTKIWQAEHGLQDDGVVGPKTRKAAYG